MASTGLQIQTYHVGGLGTPTKPLVRLQMLLLNIVFFVVCFFKSRTCRKSNLVPLNLASVKIVV